MKKMVVSQNKGTPIYTSNTLALIMGAPETVLMIATKKNKSL